MMNRILRFLRDIEKTLQDILRVVRRIEREVLAEEHEAHRAFITFDPPTSKKESSMANTVSLTVQQQVTARWNEADAGGAPVPPTGPITWTSADPTIATVTASADTFSALVVPQKAGTVVITAAGDGFTVTGTVTVTDVATSASISFDDPVAKPAA